MWVLTGPGRRRREAETHASIQARELAVAVLFGQGAEAVVVVGLFDPTRHQAQGQLAPAAVLGLARADAAVVVASEEVVRFKNEQTS